MTDSSQTQGNKGPGEKNNPSDQHTIHSPSAEQITADKKSEAMTEKFLTVAKEKNNLESIIMSQNDIIKGLEKEKEKLTISLRKLAASHKSMREKLLDFDILRNMEISELKKKIEKLMADSKKVTCEKDSILRNLERDQKNIFRVDNHVVESLMREKRDLEERLRKTLREACRGDEQSTQGAEDREEDGQQASLTSLHKTVQGIEKSIAAGEADLLKADTAHDKENLQQKVHDYSKEITELKTDIDELTSAIESKVHVIDALNTKVDRLSEELIHKDSELHDKIPTLLEKINSLSQSIDIKMEENSLFAKELFDLNVKLSALNEEMIEKDELLIEISTDYKRQKDDIEALHGAHELTLRNLVHERNLLKKECEDLRSMPAIPLEQRNNEQQEKLVLEGKLSEALKAMDELSRENAKLTALISEKDTVIHDLQRDVELMKAKVERAKAEQAESLAALQEQFSAMNQQLLEKNEILNSLTAECSQNSTKDQTIANLQKELLLHQTKLEGAAAEHASDLAGLREKITFLNQQLLEKQELLTVMASERDYDKNEFLCQTELLRKDKTDLKEEMNRLMERGLEQEEDLAKHISLLDVFQKEKAGFEEDLAQAAEKINELVLEIDRQVSLSAEKDRSLSNAVAEISMLRASVEAMKASQAEIEKKMREKQDMSGLADAEKEDLQKTALEYQETFERLKQEIILLNKNLAEKEKAIEQLLIAKDGLAENISDQQRKLDHYSTEMRNLERQLNESSRDNNRFSAEHNSLAHTITGLQGEIRSLTLAREEEGKAFKDDLSSYSRSAAALGLKLEQSLHENAELRSKLKASQSAGREVPTSAIEQKEESLPAYVEKGSATKKRSLAYTLLALFLVVGIGVSFYAFNAGLIPLPVQKPAVMEEIKKELAYNDMVTLLTKVSASDDFKLQATLLTESLVLKSDAPGEKALFDFQNHLYFKVSISAPTKGLDAELVADPYPLITLTAGAESVKPLSHIQIKKSKTFYRKEEPVSIMFYCAFPRTALTPDRNTLSLSFRDEKDKADIVWDLNSLRASNLFP